MAAAFLSPLLKKAGGVLRLQNTRNGRVLADALIPAFDSNSRRRGLLGRQRFEHGSAMLIAPSNAVHTFFMKFRIDVAFVARDGRVLKTCGAVGPWRMLASLRAYAVVELPAGTLARCDTVRGDLLAIAPNQSSDQS